MRELKRKYQDDGIPLRVDRLGSKPKHMHWDTWEEIREAFRENKRTVQRWQIEHIRDFEIGPELEEKIDAYM